MLVVSAGIPAPASAIPERVLGIAIGGVLAVAAATLLWPERADVDFRQRLAAALDRLAELAAGLGAGPAAGLPGDSLEQARSALAGARAFALGVAQRPLGAARIAVAERELAVGLRDAAELLAGVGADLGDGDRALLRATGVVLGEAAGVLQDESAPPPDRDAYARTRAAYADASERHVAGLLSDGSAPATIARTGDRVFHLRRLAVLADAVARQASVAAGRADREPTRSTAARVTSQLAVRLAPDSVLLHNALRLALGLAAARAVAGVLDLEHGFWVVFATLTVTRATARGTSANAARAVLGTAIGAVLATLVMLAFEAEADVYVVLIPVFAFLAVYGSAVSFVAGQVGFTLLIVAIFNLIAPPHWEVALIRLEDVAIGAAVGLLIGVAAWPRGPAAQLRDTLAQAIDAGAAYSRTVAAGLLGSAVDPEPARREATRAARRAEDVFTAYLDEVADRPAAIERWAALLEQTQRLWFEAGVVAGAGHAGPHGCPRFASELALTADALAAEFHATGEALRRRAAPGAALAVGELGRDALDCAAAAAGSGDPARLDGVVQLLGLRAWIAALGRELDAIRAAVGALTAAPAPG